MNGGLAMGPGDSLLEKTLWYCGTMVFSRFLSYAVGKAFPGGERDMKRTTEDQTEFNFVEVVVYIDGECRFVSRTTNVDDGSITEMAYDDSEDLLKVSGHLLRTVGGMRFRWWKDGGSLESWGARLKHEADASDGELPF
jgi:hypothetical protein